MARFTQLIGLKPSAEKYLQDYGFKRDTQPYESAKHCGMFEDGPELYRWTDKEGSAVYEVVQCTPWSSGPCIFMCLEIKTGLRKFQWTEKEIDEAM